MEKHEKHGVVVLVDPATYDDDKVPRQVDRECPKCGRIIHETVIFHACPKDEGGEPGGDAE